MTAVLRLPVGSAPEPEPGVVEAAQKGERWAQAQIVEWYARPVWSLVCRVLGRAGRRGAAEDATQEALVAALESLPRFCPARARSLKAWMLTIAARTAVDVLRRQRDVVEVDEASMPSHDRPDVTAERRALARAIESAVETLSPEIRAAFVLRAYHEFEYAQIAEALGIDLGTVKSRLWRARAALQRSLAEVRRDA